jgi:hypothetical protein
LSLTVREDHWIELTFENKVLRRIYELKREDLKEEWRKLHNKKLLKFTIPLTLIG